MKPREFNLSYFIIAYLPALRRFFGSFHSLNVLIEFHVKNPHKHNNFCLWGLKLFSKFPPCLYNTKILLLLLLEVSRPHSLFETQCALSVCMCLLYLSNFAKNSKLLFLIMPCFIFLLLNSIKPDVVLL